MLQRGQTAWLRRQSFDRADARAVNLHGKREAGARRHAADLDGAGPAHAVLAADMRAGKPEFVAQKVGEQHARLGLGFVRAAVDLKADRVARSGTQARHFDHGAPAGACMLRVCRNRVRIIRDRGQGR